MLSPEELRTILADQQLECVKILADSVPREQEAEGGALWRRPGALVVTGVRRCGKSTLCHRILDGEPYGYVNFDDERLSALRTADLQAVLESLLILKPGAKNLLFDEVQNISRWELFVNRLLRSGYRIAITGSNSRLLSRELATHLTGRARVLELAPFSFAEVLRARGIGTEDASTAARAQREAAFERYLREGGFPEQVREGYRGEDIRELFDRIVIRDIAFRRKLRNPAVLKEVALLAVSMAGQRFTFQKFAKNLALSGVNTAKSYLGYLEEAYLVATVAPYSPKVREQIRLPRKIYVSDNAFAHALHARPTEDLGALLECLVHQELKRRRAEVWTFLSPKAEVDFLIREGRTVTELIQACWSVRDADTQRREVRGLLAAAEETRCRNLTIITREESRVVREGSSTIRVVPVVDWLLASPMVS